ncbi:MAG: MBL fold metallo-hydrolase, partial [Candidatus Lokiarchaeota archaeon]|nr:MBL fold metallo-hydrolase [Candidatus Lokiarchaeota archaeon]
DFYCGDLLMNKKMPTRTNLIIDKEAFERSVDRLKMLDINMVYSGHGNPFPIKEFFDNEEEGT